MEGRKLQQTAIFAMMAEEFKNPLTTVIGFADLLRTDPKRAEHYIAKIFQTSDEMLQTIDDVVSAYSASQLPADVVSFDVVALVENIHHQCQAYLKNRNQTCAFRLPRRRLLAAADKSRTAHIIRTMLHNAADFSPDDTEIQLEIRYQKQEVQIRVRDQGIQLSGSDTTRLFEQFGSMRQPLKERPESTGLALFVAQQLAQSMQATLYFSPVKSGNCVVLSLPTNEQLRLF